MKLGPLPVEVTESASGMRDRGKNLPQAAAR
jgi:hypothetical protein